MPVYAALVVRAWIVKVVGEAGNRGKLVAGLLVEIGVTATAIYRAMTDAEICNITCTVSPIGMSPVP